MEHDHVDEEIEREALVAVALALMPSWQEPLDDEELAELLILSPSERRARLRSIVGDGDRALAEATLCQMRLPRDEHQTLQADIEEADAVWNEAMAIELSEVSLDVLPADERERLEMYAENVGGRATAWDGNPFEPIEAMRRADTELVRRHDRLAIEATIAEIRALPTAVARSSTGRAQGSSSRRTGSTTSRDGPARPSDDDPPLVRLIALVRRLVGGGR